jgi:hypothetical protein
MSDDKPRSSPTPAVTELKVSAHIMELDAGVYCVFNSPDAALPDPANGLPGARLSLPPGQSNAAVSIRGLRDDGWIGAPDGAALVRVSRGPAQILMTIYQAKDGTHEAPRLQVTKLVDGDRMQTAPADSAPPPAAEAAVAPPPAVQGGAEIAAHLQGRGDVLGRLGEWVGDPSSQRWVEGFSISPRHPVVRPSDIEYQAVLGRGWLSPWAEGGQFCGSRGMGLPILGLRARLLGKAAETHTLEILATFTDGTQIGPMGPGDACEADSLAPLEAFSISIVSLNARTAERRAAEAPPPKPAKAKPAAKPKARPAKVKAAPEPASPPRRRRSS